MFILIPLILLFVSVAAIFWVVSRKFTYLKKLDPNTPEFSSEADGSFWLALFPEIPGLAKKINPRSFFVNFLAEFEKFLRKLRLISLKIDSLTNSLIGRVRKTTRGYEEKIIQQKQEKERAEFESAAVAAVIQGTAKDFKNEEQRLIIEIAKNPKNPELYKQLGELYLSEDVLDDARESFKKAVELDPNDAQSRGKLEQIVAKMGEI